MTELFISPILLEYNYLKDLSQEAKQVLGIELKDEKAEQEFKTSIFLNFNRYLTITLELMPESIKENLYEDIAEMIEDHDETKTVDTLNKLGILSEAREEFINILKGIKK